ncbi:hypothetical protein DFH08DRAFT_974120 [Mycena albidolilacea]|uniref:Peptidase S53 activation domain-containing protein n=1 Tax=Mycena albidolilacea TaxID=1033008 RepID=A0AAD7EC97_9AGAR|nr:hypothetical protein DFH08DRAFT_974120 [Mycena albidolilacea]
MSAEDWIAVDMTVYQVNRLLAAEFATFQNEETNHTADRTLSYSISNTLKSGINVIYPAVTFLFPASSSIKPLAQYLSSFPVGAMNRSDSVVNATTTVRKESARHLNLARLSSQLDPRLCATTVQYIVDVRARSTGSKRFGGFYFKNEFSNRRDLKAFLEEFRPDMNPNTTFGRISCISRRFTH